MHTYRITYIDHMHRTQNATMQFADQFAAQMWCSAMGYTYVSSARSI